MNSRVTIGDSVIGPGEPTFIIGEIGVNHNGDVNLARQLIDAGAAAGLDAVKFQSFKTERLLVRGTSKTGYQLETTGVRGDQYAMLEPLELTAAEMDELRGYTEDRGLAFLSTPYDPGSARELEEIGVRAFKISSADIVDAFLLNAVAETGMPVILSTGMSELDDIKKAMAVLERGGSRDIVLLHCVSMYPTPRAQLNLRFINALYEAFGCPVGFSDHTKGIEAAPLAVAAGACVIEKHFTLDREMEGPDHRSSLDPKEMALLVEGVRSAEGMLGESRKCLYPAELENAELMRKSLVFSMDLPEGTRIKYEHFTAKRPADGIPPMEYEEFLGRVLNRDVVMDEQVVSYLFSSGG